jgi:hypothetical protein
MSDENFEDVLQPDTFNFLDVLSERSFPKETVSIYLNAQAAHEANRARKAYADAENKASETEAKKLFKKYQDLVKASEYKFHLTGVALERIEELQEIAKEKYPVEMRNRKTASGSLEQYEVPNPLRDEYLSFLTLWVHVEAIEAPDGRIQTAPDADTIIKFIKTAPSSQVERFANAIRDIQITSNAFENAIDDDFLAKS